MRTIAIGGKGCASSEKANTTASTVCNKKENVHNVLDVPQSITFQNFQNAFTELKDYVKTLRDMRMKKSLS